MKHLKRGDTMLLKLGNSTLPAFVTYNGNRM